MNIGITLALFIGFCGIFQATLNKSMSGDIGLAHSILIGNAFLLVLSLIFYWMVQKYPQQYPEFIRIKETFTTFQWWYLVPGILGFCVVAGLPYAYFKAGAVKVTVALIAAQMIASILWDFFVEKIPVNTSKGLGLLFGALSVFFTLR